MKETLQACEGSVEEEEKRGYWTVPYAHNPNFTGREALLANLLHQYPRQETERQIDQPSLHIYSLALTGLGGIGKTQLAIEYAYRVRELEPATHIVWINAANEETLLASFLTLAKLIPAMHTHPDVDLRIQVRACLRWLEQSSTQPWVLIYDNADFFGFLDHAGLLVGDNPSQRGPSSHFVFLLRTAVPALLLLAREGDWIGGECCFDLDASLVSEDLLTISEHPLHGRQGYILRTSLGDPQWRKPSQWKGSIMTRSLLGTGAEPALLAQVWVWEHVV